VTVTVTVTNDGDESLPDLRIIDGVPAMLPVTERTARHATVLGADESTTFSYELRAEHGTHRFRPLTAIARDASGAHEVETEIAEATDEIEVLTGLPDPPVARDTEPFPGQILTDESGTGLEFSRTREYRRGDDRSRIDWNRLAKTGTLSTTEFRQEQTVSVLACIDARPAAYVGPAGEPHALSRSTAAARELLDAIWDIDERAGLAAIGREGCFLPPGRGSRQVTHARQLLLSHPALSPRPPEDDGRDYAAQFADLVARLDSDTQLFVMSPLTDDGLADVLLETAAAGRSVTVVSPDVTRGETPGPRIAAVERTNQIHRLRRGGTRVVDWNPEEPLTRSVVTERERWSR